jgi:hypothetical protein
MGPVRRLALPGTLAALLTAFLLATAAPAQAATTVAVWKMDDGGSTMADSSGRGHTGTLHHVTVKQPGKSGTAFKFSGQPSYVSVPSSGDFSPGTGNFRITMSVKFSVVPSSSVGDYDLLRRGLGTTSGGSYKVEILRSGRAFCDYRGLSGEVSVTNGPNLADNKWHTISCTRSSNSVVLGVDGASWSRSGSIGSISNSSGVYLGAKDGSGADQYAGLMDSVSITKG